MTRDVPFPTGEAREVLAKVKAHYSGISLDEVVDKELDYFEDPGICRGYRAILQRLDQMA